MWFVFMLTWLACDFANEPLDATDTDGASSGCPDGLSAARDATVIITDVQVDGLRFFSDFDPDLIADGAPAACIEAGGGRARYAFTIGGNFAGVIEVEGEPGTYDLVEDSEIAVSLSLDSPQDGLTDTYGSRSWTSGTAEVQVIDGEYIFNVASAIGVGAQGTTLDLTFSTGATIP